MNALEEQIGREDEMVDLIQGFVPEFRLHEAVPDMGDVEDLAQEIVGEVESGNLSDWETYIGSLSEESDTCPDWLKGNSLALGILSDTIFDLLKG